LQLENAIKRKGALYDKLPPEEVLPAAGVPFLPEERITLPEALAAFTINAAYTNRDEKSTGSLEVGKRADLAVLDRNLFDIPVSEISETRVLLTLFDGRPVYGTLEEL
jgi:predicted amidohydrolase YtcJ